MSKTLVFFDTETTGLKEPRLVELAYRIDGQPPVSLRCKPPKPIEIGASMVSHITDKMVAGLPAFKDRPDYQEIKELFENNILVAHNAEYDIAVMAAEGIVITKWICTKEMAKDCYPKADMLRLQYLRYWLGMEIDAEAHTAGGDLLVLEALWDKMAAWYGEGCVDKWLHSI